MTKTAKKQQHPEPEKLDEQIQRWERELEEAPREIGWDELVENSAQIERELDARERRRRILPRIIQAGKVKRLELEKRRHEEHAASLREELEASYAAFQEHEERLRQAKKKRDASHGKWMLAMSAVQSAEDRAKRTERELRQLRGEVAVEKPEGEPPKEFVPDPEKIEAVKRAYKTTLSAGGGA